MVLPTMGPEGCSQGLGELGPHDQLRWGVPEHLIYCW